MGNIVLFSTNHIANILHISDNKQIFPAFLFSIRNYSPEVIKGALSGLKQFLATESPLKMMKNAFYFTSKALFVLKIFKFLS